MPAPSFWNNLPKPFFVLAPMANVTDTVFRRLIAEHGQPDAMWTEFVSCDGLCSPGREAVELDLTYTETERPIVAQVFGAHPDHFYETAKLVASLGFDGMDINMGCPDKNVMKQGAGAKMITTPDVARACIRAAREGLKDAGSSIPLSVKTRVGFNKDEIDTWIPKLLEMDLPLLTIHARTKKEMSKVPARWERVKRVVEMAQGTGTLIVGNGDATDLADARQKAEESGADGVMLGRAIFGNPWLFDRNGYAPAVPERLQAMVRHTRLFEEVWAGRKSFDIMKKHYKAYAHGFDGAKELRVRLMECSTAAEVSDVVEDFLKN